MNNTGVRKWMPDCGDGERPAVVATSAPESLDGAISILREGGTATDAVLSAVLAQIVLSAGSWVSFAGILSFIHYDAATGNVAALNGGFNTVLNETDPLSIPRSGKSSGRSALTPGLPAALFAAHGRYGGKSIARVFEHALLLASDGFIVDATLAGLVKRRRKVLTRSHAGRSIFLDGRGQVPTEDDKFRQPELAATFAAAVENGPEYFYRGPWSERLVAAVRRQDGRMTSEDLALYQPLWTEPVRARVGEADVFAPGFPTQGGMYLVEALHTADLAHSGGQGWTEADLLFWTIQITRARYFAGFLEPQERLRKSTASVLWHDMQWLGRLQLLDAIAMMNRSSHSDGVVARDRYGNVAAVCHSINTLYWGSTGMFVDGVSISDAGSYQQHAIARVGLGKRLPDDTNPAIVLRDNRPVLACAAVGASLHEVTVQSLVDVLLRGESVSSLPPNSLFLSPEWAGLYRLGAVQGRVLGRVADAMFAFALRVLSVSNKLSRLTTDLPVRIPRGGFDRAVIEGVVRRGQSVAVIDVDAMPSVWVGLAVSDGGSTPETCVRSTSPGTHGCVRVG